MEWSSILLATQLVLHGKERAGHFGDCLVSLADVNGDAFPDVAVGAPEASRVAVFSGRDGQLLYELQAAKGDRFGVSLAAVGDVDRDGAEDLLIGAPGMNGKLPRTGVARLVSGRDGGTLHQFGGVASFDGFGLAVAAAGDVDGDGLPDVAIGSTQADEHRGAVEVRSGASGGLIARHVGEEAEAAFASAIAGRPGELAVGAQGSDGSGFDAGSVVLFTTATGARRQVIRGEAGDRFGSSLAWIGDVDGDGVDDLAVGAPGNDQAGDEAGRVSVHSGALGQRLFALDGERPGDEFGEALAAVGDWNGDGRPDLAASASQYYNGGGGYVRVHSGADGTLLARRAGPSSGSFGRALHGMPDTDGDGRAELLVGEPAADGGLGAVRLMGAEK